jgi:putative PEP-CTERM system TPR-repeat lipoprotein
MASPRFGATALGFPLALLLGSLGHPVLASQGSDKARAALEQGDLRTATMELRSALQSDPNDADARLLLARVHLLVGNGEGAEKEIRVAIDLGAESGRWRLDLVEALILQGRFDEALQRLEAGGEVADADAVRTLILRGKAALGQQRPDEARALFLEAQGLDPTSAEAGLGAVRVTMSEGDNAATSAALDDLLVRFPDNLDALLMRAELYRLEGKLGKANELFGKVLQQDPKNAPARLGQATVLIGQGKLEQARKILGNLGQAEQAHPMSLYLMAVLDFQDKNWDGAAKGLDKVLSVMPDHLQSQLLLGIIRYSEGELEIADEYLSNVLGATPENVQARKVLAATRIKMREPKRAIEVLLPIAQGGDPQTLALLGSAYMLDGNLEQGQAWLDQAVTQAPDTAALRTQLALSLLAGGETDKAIDELQAAVDLGQDILQADVLLVLAHLKNKEFDQALAASERLEQRHPDSPIPHNVIGLAHLAKGDLPAAEARFDKALEVDPAFATAYINLARVDVAQNDLDGAEGRFQRVLESNPKHLGALLGLAALAEQRGDSDGLVAALERAQNANPTATQPGLLLARYHITRGDHLKALTVANDLAGRFPEDAAVLQMLARAQTLVDQVPNALRTFDQLIQRSPDDPQLRYLIGGAHWKAKSFKEAQDAFRKALELKPDFLDAEVALASVSLDSGDTQTALASARALQSAYPDQSVGYRVEGRIRKTERQPEAAAVAFQQAFDRQRSSVTARELAESLYEAGRTADAVQVLEGWMKDAPDDLDSKAMLGLYLQQAGRPTEAISVYEAVVEGSQQANPLLLNNLAWLYHEQGDQRARAVAKQAYELAPTRPEVADTYGWILYHAGEKAQGLNILQQAYLASPSQTEIGYHVAVALEGLGRQDESVQVLRRILRDDPKAQHANDAQALLDKLGG